MEFRQPDGVQDCTSQTGQGRSGFVTSPQELGEAFRQFDVGAGRIRQVCITNAEGRDFRIRRVQLDPVGLELFTERFEILHFKADMIQRSAILVPTMESSGFMSMKVRFTVEMSAVVSNVPRFLACAPKLVTYQARSDSTSLA